MRRNVIRLVTIVALAVPLIAATPGQESEPTESAARTPRAMTVDDALDLVSVGSPTLSPDGATLLYTRRTLDWDDNDYETEVWAVPATGGDAFRYLGDEGGSDLAYSPDGRYLSFKRSVGEGPTRTQQLFWMRTGGGEAVQLTEHATSVGRYRWSAGGRHVFFVADDERSDDDKKAVEKGDDAIFVDEGPNGQTRDQWSNLWRFDVETKEEEQLTEERFLIGSFDISADERWAALSARYSNRRNDGDKSELFLLDLDSGEKTRLTNNRAPEGGVLWSPDSRRFLFSAADDEQWLNRNTKLWLMEAALGEHRLISERFPGNISSPVWSTDGTHVLFVGTEGVRSNVFRLEVDSGEVTRITDRDGVVRGISWSRDRGRFAYGHTDSRNPTDLWSATTDDGASTRLTEANPQVELLRLASMRTIRWTSPDGTEIEGLLHLPDGFEEGRAYPLMLNIHGGPAGVFVDAFRASYHLYAGLGWVSLSPNVRGSCCYDDELREGNTVARGDGIGLGDLDDLMSGVDALIAAGIADADRLALRGWSYGGILGGWTITQTDRFKAASIGAGVYDWTSEYGPGFNNDVRLWHIGGTPWDNPDAWRHQSALTHAANVTTPTLLIHGVEDRTDTEPQSMMFFTALKDIGKAPVRYLRFPREPHGFREPRHQRRRDVEEVRWMQQHVLGQEWEEWERAGADVQQADDADTKQDETAG